MIKKQQGELFLVNERTEKRAIRLCRKENALLVASWFKERQITGNISYNKYEKRYEVTANCSDAEFEAVREKFNTRPL